MSESVDGGDLSNDGEEVASKQSQAALRTQAFEGLSIGLPDRVRLIVEHSGEVVLRPSRFQPEHTLVAALGGAGQNPLPDPLASELPPPDRPTSPRQRTQP